MQQNAKLSVVTNYDGIPSSVILDSKKLQITKILQFWRTNNNWWQTGIFGEQKFWRVVAESAQKSVVIEICYDQNTVQWKLIRKLVE
ncbi:MAG: hypothetical protein FJW76_05090 [Actinobacteria bacterium]|nr:hypothetical protein [Actinomycetota bacterium]